MNRLVTRYTSELWGIAHRDPKFVPVTTGGLGQSAQTGRIQLRENPRTQLEATKHGWQPIAWSRAVAEDAEAGE